MILKVLSSEFPVRRDSQSCREKSLVQSSPDLQGKGWGMTQGFMKELVGGDRFVVGWGNNYSLACLLVFRVSSKSAPRELFLVFACLMNMAPEILLKVTVWAYCAVLQVKSYI